MMSGIEGFVIENGVLRLYTGTDASVSVPRGVIALGQDAFRECRTLEHITLPEGLREIGQGAFWGCEALVSVRFPASLDSIGAWGFYGCRSLERVSLPDSLHTLWDNSFRNCGALRELRLPDGLERIPVSAFEGCASLESLLLPEGLREIGSSAFRGCSSLRSLTLPASLTEIGQRAFWGCGLQSIALGGALERIGSDAFYYCTQLRSVALPESLVCLGRCAFYGCSALDDIRFPSHSVDTGRYAFFKTAWWEAQPEGCVMAGSTLYQYKGSMPPDGAPELPAGIGLVAEYAFSGCAGLKRVALPDGVVSVGDHAFEDCSNLTEVLLPDSLRSIGARAFLRCTSLSTLAFPSQLASIGSEAFRGCIRLEDAVLPGSLRFLGEGAFSGCEALRRFSVDGEGEFFLARDGVLFTRPGKELAVYPVGRPDRSYTVPEGVERILPGAFSGVYRLKTLLLPGTLTGLEPGTFTDTALEYVRLPRGIARLAPKVFRSETYVGIYYPELAEKLDRPVFLGGPVQLISPRRRGAALLGFLSGTEHGETILDRWKGSYTDYIRANEAACARIAAQNETLLHLMMEERLLSGSSTEELLNSAIAEERTDLTAELLSYKKRVYPPRPGDIFSLEEEPAAASRAGDAARRRDALLRRIGIGGLRLAAVGRFRKFGFYSPQGVIDLSDLAAYIRKHGGQFQTRLAEDTDALICNDPGSAREKILQAAEMGIPVISEAEFLQLVSESPRSRYSYET